MGKEEEAKELLAKAQAAESSSEYAGTDDIAIHSSIVAAMAYDFRSQTPGDAAAAVATVARALKLGSSDTATQIVERLAKSKHWEHQKLLADLGIEPTWDTADRVLTHCSISNCPRRCPSPARLGVNSQQVLRD
jgi:hypothetical protein